jgi:hypothetical protein
VNRDEFKFRASGPYIHKDADEVKDYPIDWTDWLADGGNDSIQVSTWSVPAGLTQSNATVVGAKTVVFLSGGTEGTTYHVTNRIVTAGGRTAEEGFDVIIKAK